MNSYPLYKGNKLNGGKCEDCGHVRFPRMDYCNKCQSTNISEYLIGPEGKLMSYTISYRKPMVGNIKPPYPYAVARFPTENGNHVDVFGMIAAKEPFENVKINENVVLKRHNLLVKFKMEADVEK
jgi:uncharacterized OB-fold protein